MRRRGESGQVLPLIAICLAALMGFGGMAVDVGYWRYQLREQQSATDAAALGGAQQLVYSSCPNQSAATTAAQNDAANGGFSNGGNVTVTVANPPTTGVFAGNTCAVLVHDHHAEGGVVLHAAARPCGRDAPSRPKRSRT